MSSKNSAGDESTLTWELETPNSGTRFRIHWNLCTPSGHRQQGGEVTWGTAGDSKGAKSSHGDLVKETRKGSHFSNASSEVSLSYGDPARKADGNVSLTNSRFSRPF